MLCTLLRIASDVKVTTLQSLKFDGNAFEKSKHGIVSEIALRGNYQINFHLHFVFCNLFCFAYSRECGVPCFLFNPLKGEVLMLPTSCTSVDSVPSDPHDRMYNPYIYHCYGMGFDNITNTHKIVRVCGNNYMRAQVLELGTSSWKEISSVPPCGLSTNNLSAYGDMHWVVYVDHSSYHIISFDFKKEEFYRTPQPTSLQAILIMHLINWRGSMAIMALVNISSGIYGRYIELWVMKNYDKKDWALDYSINLQTLQMSAQQLPGGIRDCYGEWKHGIFFAADDEDDTAFFWDLRCGSMKRIKCPTLIGVGEHKKTIISYTGSLITLENYGNLVEAQVYNSKLDFSKTNLELGVYEDYYQLWDCLFSPKKDGNLVETEAGKWESEVSEDYFKLYWTPNSHETYANLDKAEPCNWKPDLLRKFWKFDAPSNTGNFFYE